MWSEITWPIPIPMLLAQHRDFSLKDFDKIVGFFKLKSKLKFVAFNKGYDVGLRLTCHPLQGLSEKPKTFRA